MLSNVINRYRNILYIRFQESFSRFPPEILNKFSPVSPFKRFVKIILYTGGRLLPNLFSFPAKNQQLHNTIWLYVVSQNNYDSLHFLKDALPGAVFVAGQHKQIGRYNNQVARLSLRWKLFYTLWYFFPVLWGLYQRYGTKAIRFFDLIYIAIGYYEHYLWHLKKHKPKAVIFSNDHNDDARAMLLAAKACGIPTIYVQHASVNADFPPLEFDLNLLEGQDALDKYRQCGPISGKVELVGMPKADKAIQYRNFRKTTQVIGICGNLLDDYHALKETIFILAETFPELTFTFRPHPGDKRDFSYVKTAGRNLNFSDPGKEAAFKYLTKLDVLIAADSSIHLEAVMLNIPAIYFPFGESDFTYDYYGYAKNELVLVAKSKTELMETVRKIGKNKPEVFKKAAYYNATIGTQSEGKSSELAITKILAYLKYFK